MYLLFKYLHSVFCLYAPRLKRTSEKKITLLKITTGCNGIPSFENKKTTEKQWFPISSYVIYACNIRFLNIHPH